MAPHLPSSDPRHGGLFTGQETSARPPEALPSAVLVPGKQSSSSNSIQPSVGSRCELGVTSLLLPLTPSPNGSKSSGFALRTCSAYLATSPIPPPSPHPLLPAIAVGSTPPFPVPLVLNTSAPQLLLIGAHFCLKSTKGSHHPQRSHCGLRSPPGWLCGLWPPALNLPMGCSSAKLLPASLPGCVPHPLTSP